MSAGNLTDLYYNKPDICKYVLHRETVESRQGKWKLWHSMEPIFPQSLGMSDSGIL